MKEKRNEKIMGMKEIEDGGVYVMIVTDCLIVETRGRRWGGGIKN